MATVCQVPFMYRVILIYYCTITLATHKALFVIKSALFDTSAAAFITAAAYPASSYTLCHPVKQRLLADLDITTAAECRKAFRMHQLVGGCSGYAE